jgi:hypothetical protein
LQVQYESVVVSGNATFRSSAVSVSPEAPVTGRTEKELQSIERLALAIRKSDISRGHVGLSSGRRLLSAMVEK